MKRAALEKARTVRVWRKHLSDHLNSARGPLKPEDSVGCRCDNQVGRFRKGQRWRGCGRPRCLLCHYEKIMGIPKVNELKARAVFREQLDDIKGD